MLLPFHGWFSPVVCYAKDKFIFSIDDVFLSITQYFFLYRYNLYLDCMPTDSVESIDEESLNRIVKWAQGPKSLSNDAR